MGWRWHVFIVRLYGTERVQGQGQAGELLSREMGFLREFRVDKIRGEKPGIYKLSKTILFWTGKDSIRIRSTGARLNNRRVLPLLS